MGHTVSILGSNEVLADFGTSGVFYRGKWQNIKVIKVGPDRDTPLEIRKSLVGLTIATIFTQESIEKQTGATFPIARESRLAYADEVAAVLRSAGKEEAAKQLEAMKPEPYMYVFEPETYELV